MPGPYHNLLRRQKAERLDPVRRTLEAHGGNINRAAKELGLSHASVWQMAELHGWGIPRLPRGTQKDWAWRWSWNDVR